jgi:hypothetical protein
MCSLYFTCREKKQALRLFHGLIYTAERYPQRAFWQHNVIARVLLAEAYVCTHELHWRGRVGLEEPWKP